GFSLAILSDRWESVSGLYSLFSLAVLARFIHFLITAFAITGGAILFAFFYWEGGKTLDGEYHAFVKRTALRITFAAAFLQPLFLVINIVTLPQNALSGSVFGYAALSLILIFAAYHFLYAMIKEGHIKYSGHV